MQNDSMWLRVCAFVVLFFSASLAPALADEAFPRPPELEPAIQFWITVYTQSDSNSGFLHDSFNLGVIYRKVDFDRREIEQYRTRIQSDLQVLATGKRTGLTGHQQAVLEAWPADVSNEQLAAAANTVRFQRGQSDRFVAGLIRSGAYRGHITRVTQQRGLPVELGVLPHVESSFHPGAYSHANAAGMWQFIRSTGQRFMRVDHIVDERMDPYTATYAAMSLLEANYNALGTWPLALTAYNHGAAGMARAVRETGSNRIEDIILNYRGRAFGFAGRNFYPQFLAVIEVERRAQALFGVLQLDPAPDYDEFELPAYIEARTLADTLGVTVQQLRFDNPALRPIVWEGGKRIPKGYTVKIQRKSINAPLQRLVAGIPDNQLYAYQTPDVSYVVQRGDSLSVIAQRFNTSVAQLASLNQLSDRNTIRVGQELLLPHDTNMATQTLVAAVRDITPGDGVYTVMSGDTLSDIARRAGASEADIMQLNGMNNPDRLFPGQELRLPAESEQPVARARVNEAPLESSPEPALVGPVLPPEVAERIAASQAIADADEEQAVGMQTALSPGTVSSEGAGVLARETMPSVREQVASATELLAADPSDYSVASDSSIEIQATETLGHYADWLGIRTQQLRNLNGMNINQLVIVGNRLTLDFSEVDAEEFELRRRQYHIAQQEQFFRNFRIQDVDRYEIAANENIATIARQRYSVPLWLLRQYNPDLDFRQVRVGQTVVFPVVERVDDA